MNRGFELAELAQAVLDRALDWEVVTPAQLGIITFRYAPSGVESDRLDRLNRALVRAMIEDGFAMIGSTVLRGQTVLCLCTIKPRTTEADIRDALMRLDRMASPLLLW